MAVCGVPETNIWFAQRMADFCFDVMRIADRFNDSLDRGVRVTEYTLDASAGLLHSEPKQSINAHPRHPFISNPKQVWHAVSLLLESLVGRIFYMI